MDAITLDVIRRRSGQFDVTSIQWLDLSESGLRAAVGLEPCVNLRSVDLRCNKVLCAAGALLCD
jgi:hypothetical protein